MGTPLSTDIGERAVVEAGLVQEQQRGLTAEINEGKYKLTTENGNDLLTGVQKEKTLSASLEELL